MSRWRGDAASWHRRNMNTHGAGQSAPVERPLAVVEKWPARADRDAIIDEVVAELERMTGMEWTKDKRIREIPSTARLQLTIAIERVKGMKGNGRTS